MGKVTAITDALAVACPQCRAAAGEKCKNWRGSGCAPHRQRSAAAAATPPAPAADDFDESTPPPRGRPIGQPVPRFVRLPPGESPLGAYLDWDRKGRIPAGSILCDHIGTSCGTAKHSGYRVAGLPELVSHEQATALGCAGQMADASALERFVVAVVIVEATGNTLAVFAPRSGGKS